METKTESKTIREWLNDLPEDIRERAVRNYVPNENEFETSLKWAVHGGFVWSDTPEGFSFWAAVHDGAYEAARATLNQSPPSPDLREQLDEANKKIDEAVRLLKRAHDELKCKAFTDYNLMYDLDLFLSYNK